MEKRNEEYLDPIRNRCSLGKRIYNVLQKVQDLSTTKEIWARLENLYDHKTLQNKFWKERLFGFKMDKTETLDFNIDQFNMINAQLANLDKKLDQEDQLIILLNALLKSYNELKTTVEYGREDLILDFVISSIKSWELGIRNGRKDLS